MMKVMPNKNLRFVSITVLSQFHREREAEAVDPNKELTWQGYRSYHTNHAYSSVGRNSKLLTYGLLSSLDQCLINPSADLASTFV